MPPTACPGAHDLQALLDGESTADDLASHLETCAACRDALETLAAVPSSKPAVRPSAALSPLRVAYVTNAHGVGGAERMLLALVADGRERGFEQIVLNPFATEASAALRDACFLLLLGGADRLPLGVGQAHRSDAFRLVLLSQLLHHQFEPALRSAFGGHGAIVALNRGAAAPGHHPVWPEACQRGRSGICLRHFPGFLEDIRP